MMESTVVLFYKELMGKAKYINKIDNNMRLFYYDDVLRDYYECVITRYGRVLP